MLIAAKSAPLLAILILAAVYFMLNLSSLKKGNIVKILVDNEGMGLKAGDTLIVVETGRSRWDAMDYAEVVTDKGYKLEIMKNYLDFELVA